MVIKKPAVDPVIGSKESSRVDHWAWLALCVAVGLVVMVYLALSLAASADPLLMPLDDTYIHFQYARQLAAGEPMVYNIGDPATSGGTSLLYPCVLALGYRLGFTGWALAYWALGVGIACFLGAAWLIYLIAKINPLLPAKAAQPDYALVLVLAFVLSGPFVWAALSGMETALFVFTVLLTVYAVQREKLRLILLAATLMTLTRPEGVILVGVLAVLWARRVRWALWLAVPLLAGLAQPVINMALTGSASSAGMQAKSHFYNTSVPVVDRLISIFEFLGRMGRELLSGYSADWGTFTSPLLAVAALAALFIGIWLAWRARRMTVAPVMLAWMVVLTAAVATLDTAFWQFKRYQLPIMALFFPAAAWASAVLGDLFETRLKVRWARWGVPVLILVSSLFTTVTFARNYVENVTVVRDQQVPMARWIKANLPDEARIGVHDVGLVRYFGNRALYDVVGLTTPGAALAWRQGPGAVYEHMAASAYRPDYFAIYPDVQGLPYLRDAGVLGEVLAEFPVTLPAHNVASATDYQAVYRADWSDTRAEELVAQTTTLDYLARVEGLQLVDTIDVGNLESEAAHDYRWWQWWKESPVGFVTEVYRHRYHACGRDDEAVCWATDGGRVLTGGEEFTVKTIPGQDLLLVTRVHGRTSAPLLVHVGQEHFIAIGTQPQVPGRWVEVVMLIPGKYITSEATQLRIEIDPGSLWGVGPYFPFQHWIYQGTHVVEDTLTEPAIAHFGFGETIRLIQTKITQNLGSVTIDLTWTGQTVGTPGDGVLFIHLYNSDNINTEPVMQVVERPASGVLPPENWLPGITVKDSYVLELSDTLAPGHYKIAIGFFDATDTSDWPRFHVISDKLMVDDYRLFIGEIVIEELAQ